MSSKITSIRVITFSPTGTSQTVADTLAQALAINIQKYTYNSPIDIQHIPITTPKDMENAVADYAPHTLYICVCPVYSGRIAPLAMERLEALQLQGKNASGVPSPVIPVVVYGNRHYDDALLELSDFFESKGFVTISGGAFIGEHTFSTAEMPVAPNRPDADDMAKVKQFAEDTVIQLKSNPSLRSINGIIYGNRPYKTPSVSAPAAPEVNKDVCTECGECVDICPTGAIKSPFEVDIEACIKCCACVKKCPEGARIFDTPVTKKLYDNFTARREPEVFTHANV